MVKVNASDDEDVEVKADEVVKGSGCKDILPAASCFLKKAISSGVNVLG
jgi:hypothetical protein